MSTERANMSIECSIKNCAYHCCDKDYCSLDKIKVGSHECDPTKKQCTDCMSFKMKETQKRLLISRRFSFP